MIRSQTRHRLYWTVGTYMVKYPNRPTSSLAATMNVHAGGRKQNAFQEYGDFGKWGYPHQIPITMDSMEELKEEMRRFVNTRTYV